MIINNKTNISLLLKRILRKSLNARTNCPVIIIPGSNEPKLKGSGYHYTNKSGEVINYPSAYMKAYGKPIYIPSSIRIEVGSDWLLNKLSINNLRLIKLKAFL